MNRWRKIGITLSILPLALPIGLAIASLAGRFEGPVNLLLLVALLAAMASFISLTRVIGSARLASIVLGGDSTRPSYRMRQYLASIAVLMAVIVGVGLRVAPELDTEFDLSRSYEAVIGLVILIRAALWIWRRSA